MTEYPKHVRYVPTLHEIEAECHRQDQKWGAERAHTSVLWLTILMEEVGEVARAIIEEKPGDYRKELVQVAAVVVQAIQSHDRLQEDFRRRFDANS